ncbi:MAG: GyrI-like domain-containing protein [Planctomycetes bacterium]|nr:GyrI-like domain-containing protein [Planctomycetota bacterium]
MEKIDLKKELKHLYAPSAKAVVVVNVPLLNYLMIDGVGDPNVEAVEALYALAYTLKFKIKKGTSKIDYAVMPLEGLWWVDDMRQFSVKNKDAWKWTMMIVQPKYVTTQLVEEAAQEVKEKKNPPPLVKIRFESYHEGQAAQMMHIGPYTAEEPTITAIHNYIAQNNFERRGKHHEIYLKDPRKIAPEKLLTVIRQPFKK